MKSKVHKLEADKLVTVPVYLSKLSDDVVQKDVYNARKKDIEDTTSDITNLATNTILNAKINEVKKNLVFLT